MGWKAGLDLSLLDRQIVGAVAKPLAYAVDEPAFAERARALGLGVALPGQAWRNQLAADHPKRNGVFATLPIRTKNPLELERPVRSSALDAYAERHVVTERLHGASLLTTPGHVHEREGGQGRDNDLQLAHAALTTFSQMERDPLSLTEPALSIFATIIVEPASLKDATITRLISDYAEIATTGYWLWAVNSENRKCDTTPFTDLALGLEAASGRPVMGSGIGRAGVALLSQGLSAACLGHHGLSLKFPPEILDDEDELGVHIYHPRILSGFELGAKGADKRRRAFELWPCPCGHHPPRLEPLGRRAVLAHNLYWMVRQAAWAGAVPEARADISLARLIDGAKQSRARLRMSALSPSWNGVREGGNRFRGRRQTGLTGS